MRIPRTSLLALLGLVLGCGAGSQDRDRIAELFGNPSYGVLNRDLARQILATSSTADKPFYLIDLMRYRDRAVYPDGRATRSTGREADAAYDALVSPGLSAVGAEILFVGDVERSLIDPDGAAWSRLRVVRFPSRAAYVALLEARETRAAMLHHAAGTDRAITLLGEPVEPQLPADIRRVDLKSVPFPPTPTDQPVTVAHLLDFNDIATYADGRPTDLTGREAMQLYERGRQSQAFPLGVRPGLTLTVLGELVGDGRPWEEVRINNFPSRATFEELVTSESLDGAGIEHRQAALADTYALLVAPVRSQVGYLPRVILAEG